MNMSAAIHASPGPMRNRPAVRATHTAVAMSRNRFLRPPKSPIAPTTGMMSAVVTAETVTARVHQTPPRTSSGAIARAK